MSVKKFWEVLRFNAGSKIQRKSIMERNEDEGDNEKVTSGNDDHDHGYTLRNVATEKSNLDDEAGSAGPVELGRKSLHSTPTPTSVMSITEQDGIQHCLDDNFQPDSRVDDKNLTCMEIGLR